MKKFRLRGIHFIMFFAFVFMVANADIPPIDETLSSETDTMTVADDELDSDDAFAVDPEEAENINAIANGDNLVEEELTDAEAEYGPQLSPMQYAKVKTKRKIFDLIARFLINTIFCFIITRCFYFPKSRRRDFFFTYMLVGFAIFMLIHLMSGETMETGIGMGLFAIFCIMRYRTESVPIREMTYLFVIIAMAALNGMAWDISMKKPMFLHREIVALSELFLTNILFVIIVWFTEGRKIAKGLSSKYINYDKIDLILPEKHDELIEDLKKRTGLDITSVNIGNIDFLKDMAFIKIFYKDTGDDQEMVPKMPKTFSE